MAKEIGFPLRKFVAPEFIFGAGARRLAGRYAKNFGASKVLVVTDPGVCAAGWPGQVMEGLEEDRIPYTVFEGVSPNPRDEEVSAGAEVYRSEGCDAIVAVGGGSPMDCAKGIGIVSSNRKPILEFEGVDRVPVPMPPLICVPTTSGSSADVSQFAIFRDTRERVKIAVVSKAVVPDVALIDPETLVTLSPYLTACTGIDALVHAIEAFVSTAHSPVTDLHALEAIRLVSSSLLEAVARPEDVELRGRVMLGSLEAGLAFSNASLGAVHALSHSVGGFLDLPHGECNAILLDPVIAFNFETAGDRYRKIAEALRLDLRGMNDRAVRSAIIEEIGRLKRAVGIRDRLGEKGVGNTDLPELAKKALRDPCIVTNPRRPNARDIEVVYEEAL
jgi:alcohol dehydrogenase class IV